MICPTYVITLQPNWWPSRACKSRWSGLYQRQWPLKNLAWREKWAWKNKNQEKRWSLGRAKRTDQTKPLHSKWCKEKKIYRGIFTRYYTATIRHCLFSILYFQMYTLKLAQEMILAQRSQLRIRGKSSQVPLPFSTTKSVLERSLPKRKCLERPYSWAAIKKSQITKMSTSSLANESWTQLFSSNSIIKQF